MMENQDQEAGRPRALPPQAPRTAVILPDGTKPVPLGSGTITSLLGEGGMANVYEIWNSQLEVHRAVKLVHPNCSEEAKQRFQTEIKITAKLHHPNIIEIHGVGDWNSLPYIEMEKIEGVTLEELINERGALPVTLCTAIGIMISRALSFAHNQDYVIYGHKYHGVIHRDLKPSNIMVCGDGAVKLMDFGIARPTDASIHTTDGAVLGTLQYLSPEQLDGKELDVRTDVYSLGTTLYETLTGVKAFPERNVSRLMMDKIRNRFKQLDQYAVRIPRRLRRLIQKCMQHDREKRVRTASLLLAELERIHRSLTIDTPEQVMRRAINTYGPGKVVLSTHRRFPFGLVAAALVAVGAAAFSTMYLVEAMRPRSVAPVVVAPPAETTPPKEEEEKATPAPAPANRPVERRTAAKPVKATRPTEPQARTVPGAEPAKPATKKTESFVDGLVEKHGTNDLVEIMGKEVRLGNFARALKVYDELPAGDVNTTKAVIYKLRALVGQGNASQLSSFLANITVDDGEIYLARARLAYGRSSYAQARTWLDRSLKAPRAFMDYEELKGEVYYYEALCATAEFDSSPTEASYKSALDAWYQVRSTLRSDPNHRHNRKALSETQRIGEKFRETKG